MDIFIALVLGYWFGIAFDAYTLDAAHMDETESVGSYLAAPAHTIARAFRLLRNAIAE